MSHLVNGMQALTPNPSQPENRACIVTDTFPYQAERIYPDTLRWPRSRLFSSGEPYASDGSSLQTPYYYEDAGMDAVWGIRTLYSVIGVSRDSSGNPLGSCTIELYDTATNTLRGTVISDSYGNFRVQSNLNTAHYIVAYLAGSPDISGTTVNTLTPVFV